MHDRSTFKLALEMFEVQRSLFLEIPYNPYKLRAYAKIPSVEEMMRWGENVPTTERLTRLRLRERRWTLACLIRFGISGFTTGHCLHQPLRLRMVRIAEAMELRRLALANQRWTGNLLRAVPRTFCSDKQCRLRNFPEIQSCSLKGVASCSASSRCMLESKPR